jgi:hypothetical protein
LFRGTGYRRAEGLATETETRREERERKASKEELAPEETSDFDEEGTEDAKKRKRGLAEREEKADPSLRSG